MWLLSVAVIMVWLWIDQTPPAWDQGDHLSRAMKHWQVMQQARWLSGDWWRELWQQAPTQRAPVTYLLTVLTFNLFGTGFDQGVYVNFIFTAILLGSTYAVGRRVFSPTVGRWAAGLSLLSPVLVDLQRDYLLDYPMTAMVMFMFMGMTYFWLAKKPLSRWLTIPLWGIGLGLMLMTRTSGLLFMIPSVGWMLGASLFQRQWLRLGQVILGVGVGMLTIWPWFSTNWLTVISTTLASNSHGIIYRDDPQADTLAGWLFYPEQLPQMLSWPLFCLAAIACLLIAARALLRPNLPLTKSPLMNIQPDRASRKGWIWLLVFIVGTYILFSLG
ncbi:MAG: ArnT family glycosyltransferase, partial [Phormidesmis sp.]